MPRPKKTQGPSSKTPPKSRRSRSAAPRVTGAAAAVRFPRHTIDQALRIPRAILEQNAGKECTQAEAAGFLGIKATGAFNVEVASASKYGLLDRQKGKLQPSDLAKSILRPQDPREELQAYRDVVRQTPVISDVYNHYRGENLPDDKFFANALTDKFKIPTDKVVEFREIFLAALDKAQLLATHGDKARVLDITSEQAGGGSAGPSPTLEKLSKSVKLGSGDTCFVMMPFAEPHGAYYEKCMHQQSKRPACGRFERTQASSALVRSLIRSGRV